MLIEEHKLRHWIDNFYGYGSWTAKFWFISYEESGGDLPEEVADKVNWFYDNHKDSRSLCDLRELYRHVSVHIEGPKAGVFENRFEYRFGDKAIQHGVWKNLIAFMHGYENKKVPDVLSFQKNKFGIAEALIPLYPLPSPHNHAWYYSWLDAPGMKFLKSRSLYEDHVYPKRIHGILSAIKEHKPEIVLMYGMNNINTLKQSIQSSFPGAEFKLAKKTRLEIPQHHRAELGKTQLILTTQIPALRHGRVETGFEWAKFGQILRS